MKTRIHCMLCLALLLSLLFTVAPVGAQTCNPAFVTKAGAVITVKPTSTDDTANLQCAFDLAVATGRGQTVRLLKGTYHIGMIFVNDFVGTFTGVSAKDTVVTSLPDLYVSPGDMVLYPPSPENVWPDLISFVESDFSLSDMAFQINGEEPTLPWTIFGIDPPLRVLSAPILIIGDQTHAYIEGILVEGVPLPGSLFGYNLINGIAYVSYFGSPTGITGSYTVKDSTFRHINAGTPVTSPYEASVLITRNVYEDNLYAMIVEDTINTYFEFSQNKVNAVYGLDMYNLYTPEDVGSTYLIKNNELRGTNGLFVEKNFGVGISCLLMGNNVQNITDIGIYLGPGTNGCTVIGGSTETNVVDLGTDNVLVGVNNMGTGVGPIIHSFKRLLR